VRESSRPGRLSRHSQAPVAVGDLAFDARLLADYGNPPQSSVLAPLYAWRVLRRRRELARALVGRREEVARTANEAEDALVAFAERVRPAAEKQPPYASAIEELRRAEDLLRSRDRVLASEQDAQNARIAQVDARLSKFEEELAQAQADERAAAGELAATQAALAREEAKLKRAEVELRAAQHRESSGEVGG
jgi:chromosome segregation ATPase